MSASPSRFPTPLPIDPWWNVFLPAMMGERVFVENAVERLLAEDPDGDTLAVCARALYAGGDVYRAERLATESIRRGGVEAERLAVQFRVDGRERAPALAAGTTRRGVRAEVWCDVAGRALLEGDVIGAEHAIDAAADALADHAETQRWLRFLSETAEPDRCFAAAGRTAPRGIEATAMRDSRALLAHRRNGFVSAERWQRRHAAEGFEAFRGSALDRLREAGVPRTRLFVERDLARCGASDPRAELEIRADQAVSLVDEGRPAFAVVRSLLADVRRFEPSVMDAAARCCAGLAARDPALVPDTLDTLERLLPHDPLRWTPWVALLGRTSRPERSMRFARTLLGTPGTPPDAFLLAHDTLRLCGAHEEARAFAVNAEDRPGLREAARIAIAARPDDPPRGLPSLHGGWAGGAGRRRG